MTVVIMEPKGKTCWISGTHWNLRLFQNALVKPPNSLPFCFPAFYVLQSTRFNSYCQWLLSRHITGFTVLNPACSQSQFQIDQVTQVPQSNQPGLCHYVDHGGGHFPEVGMGDWTSNLRDNQDRYFKALVLYLKKTFISGFWQSIQVLRRDVIHSITLT